MVDLRVAVLHFDADVLLGGVDPLVAALDSGVSLQLDVLKLELAGFFLVNVAVLDFFLVPMRATWTSPLSSKQG